MNKPRKPSCSTVCLGQDSSPSIMLIDTLSAHSVFVYVLIAACPFVILVVSDFGFEGGTLPLIF